MRQRFEYSIIKNPKAITIYRSWNQRRIDELERTLFVSSAPPDREAGRNKVSRDKSFLSGRRGGWKRGQNEKYTQPVGYTRTRAPRLNNLRVQIYRWTIPAGKSASSALSAMPSRAESKMKGKKRQLFKFSLLPKPSRCRGFPPPSNRWIV